MLRFGWLGCHAEGIAALRALVQAGVPMAGVVTLRPELAARRSGAGDYHGLCRELGVPLYEIDDVNDAASVGLLHALSLDILFVIGWSQLLRTEALRSARLGVIGAHASLLPHNRGSAPINWALIRGETRTGNTLMWLGDDVDSGPILDQTTFCITPYDTCATLYERVAESNREMLLRLVSRLLAGERFDGARQPDAGEPALPRRRPSDGLIDWRSDARRVYDFVRALTRPYPGAFSFLDGHRWTIWSAALLPIAAPAGAEPGQVVGPVLSPAFGACGQVVACGRGTIIVLEAEADDHTVLAGVPLGDQPWTGRRWTHE